MSKFIAAVQAFVADENGVTAIEYGLIAALIGVAVAAVATDVGEAINAVFTNVATTLTTAVGG